MSRTLVVGDVHGCAQELNALLTEAAFRPGIDHLVSVGDLVNKGPDSIGVLRLVRSLGGRAVLGNHDDLVVRCADARRRGEDGPFPEYARRVVKKISDEDLAWLAALPTTLVLEEHHTIVVHAGLLPNVPLSAQPREHVLTMRSIRSDGSGTKRIEEGVPWASLWPGPLHALFGHDAVRGLQRWPYATGLDTGCVYGGRLTGMLLPERKLVSVPAEREWTEPSKGVAKQQAKDDKALKKLTGR